MNEASVLPGRRKESRTMTPNATAFFYEQERRNQRLMAYARFGLIAVLSFLEFLGSGTWRDFGYSMLENSAFLPIAFMQLWLANQKFYWPLLKYLFLTIDIVMTTYLVIIISPFAANTGTVVENFQIIRFYTEQDLQITLLFLSWVLLAFSVRFVIWFGFNASVAWVFHLLYVRQIPGAFDADSIPAALQKLPLHEIRLNPLFVNGDVAAWNIQMLIALTVGLSFVVYNSRNLVMKFYKSQLQRNILSRYFSPNLVDRLIDEGAESLPRKKSDAAILFVDIVGFTPLCERISPDELLTMLQEFHSLLEELVFEHGGNMEKYIGDALMASFGVPEERDDSAIQAYDCARDMLEKVSIWSAQRVAEGKEPIQVGIGLSYGPTITGTIGHGRNMAFVVLGQTVNMASRLQALSRDHNTQMVVSEAFHQKISSHAEDDTFKIIPPVQVKGFSQPVEIRVLKVA